MKQAAGLEPVEGADGLWSIRKGNLRCVAIALPYGGTALYSPVRKSSGTASALAPVRFLLAPNHYHNMGLSEHVAAFSEADCVCSQGARPRLEKVTGLAFSDLDRLAEALPGHASLLEPDGLKTGEVWMCLRTEDAVIWIVTDAFCGVQEKSDTKPKVGFLKPFPTYGLRDKTVFSAWVQNRLDLETPTVIVPCHGGIVRGKDLKQDICALLETL
ncbi:hypothetical protein [Roseibium sp.]|uniref:hypothetical protein n=1 Tax=Roseibium sp. TaxID=1936156 RepID=UPI003BB1FAC2